MKFLFKSVGWVLFGLMLVLAAGAGGTLWWLSRSLPTLDGQLTIAGLESPVVIQRDGHAIPVIHASSAHDAYFALGFTHAQDRLWHMETLRRLGAGRLSELGGERFLPHDRAMRTLGLYADAETAHERLSAPVREALDSYVRGINAWLDRPQRRLPPEYRLAGIEPEPWTGPDSLVWGRLMAMTLSGNWREEALHFRLAEALPPDRLTRLFPADRDDDPVSLPSLPSPGPDMVPGGSGPNPSSPILEDRAAQPPGMAPPPGPLPTTGEDAWAAPIAEALGALLESFPAPVSRQASNAWVLAGSRSATGAPLLANDPHLRLQAPNLFYLARIQTPEFSITGATVPGVPFHILGHNGHIAWGMTTTGADTEDLVIERLDPDNSDQYLAPDGPRPFVLREEIIEVRGRDPVVHRIRKTRNGPILSDVIDQARHLATEGTVIALRSTALGGDDGAEAFHRLNRARDWDTFREALSHYHSPIQNFFYADTSGTIGLQVAGRIPLRGFGDGMLPLDGTNANHDWLGHVPFDSMPSRHNPESGLLFNANNRISDAGAPFLAASWEPPFRAQRLREALDNPPHHDLDSTRLLLVDTLSVSARSLAPRLVSMSARTRETAPALDLIAGWDHRMDRDQAAPLLYHGWIESIHTALLAPVLGPMARQIRRRDPRVLEAIFDQDPGWCAEALAPRLQEPAATACGVLVTDALQETLRKLRRHHGRDLEGWRWGDAHKARLDNLTLGWVPALGRLANITIASDGADDTLGRGTFRALPGQGRFPHVHGAVFRAVYDLEDLDRSLFIQPTGQSGHPLSRHYRDLTRLWRDGAGIPIPRTLRTPHTLLTLIPEPV